MTPAALFSCLKAGGFTLRGEGDSLFIGPVEKVTAELTALVKAAKPGLLALLAEEVSMSPVERYLSIHSPTVGCGVVIERGPGQYAVVSLADYQEVCEP